MIKMNPELLIGEPTIDEQHQVLFDLGEEIKTLVHSGKGIDARPLYDKYLDHIVDHFTYEEVLMFDIGYPYDEIYRHKLSHRILQEIYLVAYRPILLGEAQFDAILELFESKFLVHLWEHDLRLAKFIREKNFKFQDSSNSSE